MSVIMFEATCINEVKEVECEKVTEKSVFTKGGRRAISSDYSSFFNTKSEAVQYLIGRCESRIASAERTIDCEKKKIENIMNL